MPKVSQVEIFKVNLPFKFAFSHALKKRYISESIFVKITLDNGTAGFGESLPRDYVTGNTQDSVFKNVCNYAASLKGLNFSSCENGINLVRNLNGIEDEGRCAVEVALLDCLGKLFTKPVSELLGKTIKKDINYSFIISAESLPKTGAVSLFARTHGYKFIKVKVGLDGDVARVGLVRRILPDADIRVDANGVWDASEALNMIEKLRQFKISCIEQPTPKGNNDAMQEVADFCPEPVIADESLCTREDALNLAQIRACDMFNVRLSKCGGIFRSLDIIKIADGHGLAFQIGCQVGESGILSAAARHLASILKNTEYMEGSYSRMLLKEDVIEEDLTPVKGVGYTLEGNGLGVKVKEEILKKYAIENILI